ncbi:TetR/AcrR family transcriptional regulator [Nocardia sp. NPDC003482]
MSVPHENLRVRRTRVLLREALVELVEQRGFDRVTVGRICEHAMVSRAAFYRHYRDKYELVEQIFDEAAAALTEGLDQGLDPVVRLRRFFDHVGDYARLYRALLEAKGSPWFAERIRTTLTDMTGTHLRASPPSDDLVATLLGGMLTDTITWWLRHDRPLSTHELADRYAHLATALTARAFPTPTPCQSL